MEILEEEAAESLFYYYFLTRKCSISTKKLFCKSVKMLSSFFLLLNLKYVLKHFGNAKH